MPVEIGDIIRTACNFVLADGTLYQNVYHHKRDGVGAFSNPVVTAAVQGWAENMYDELVSIVKNNVVEQLMFIDRIDWVVDTWEVVENIGTFTITFVPVVVAHANPNQVSPFVVFKTARPKTVGRKFLFPLTEDDQDAGILTGAAVTDIVAYADDAVNNITLAPAGWLAPGVPRTGVNEWQEFTLAVVTDLVGTQRRRRPGYGA